MNLIIRTSYLCLIAILYSSQIGLALTCNGQDLKELVKPDEVLFYTLKQEHNYGIMITIENGALTIGSVEFFDATGQRNDEDSIKMFKRLYDELLSKKDQLTISSTKKNYTSRGIMQVAIDKAYVTAGKDIVLQASCVSVTNSILRSKNIQMMCSEFKPDNCFMETDTLTLFSMWPYSMFEFIRFTFSKDPAVPPLVVGVIDLHHDKGAFVVVGACKVEFAFTKRAFK